MTRRPKKHLLIRLFMSYLWVTIPAVIFVGVYGARTVRSTYLERTAEDLEVRARLCAREIAEPLSQGHNEAVQATCADFGGLTGTRITVILADGEVVGDSSADPKAMDNHRDRPEIQAAINGESGVGQETRYSNTLNEERMYIAVAIREQAARPVVVRASLPVTAITQTLATIYNHLLMAGLAAAGLIAVVSLWLSWRITASWDQIRIGAERLAQGEFDYRVPEPDEEEISEVAGAMNRMAKHLDERRHAVGT